MIKAVLFDMDGLMINTEPLQSQAYEVVLRQYGKDPKFYSTGVIQKVGVREKDNWELIKTAHGLEEDTTVLMTKRGKVYLEILRKNLVPQPGLLHVLKLFKSLNLPMAVASSSVVDHIELVLEGLGVREYFSAVVSGQSVAHGKPAPDIFLEAAKQLGVNPKDCLVLEDAQTGVEAGEAAGATVIAVPNEFTADQDLSSADKIVASLADIDLKMIKAF